MIRINHETQKNRQLWSIKQFQVIWFKNHADSSRSKIKSNSSSNHANQGESISNYIATRWQIKPIKVPCF